MCSGDVLLSVNGESVEGLNHPKLVAKIQESKDTLRYSNNIQNITINSHHHHRQWCRARVLTLEGQS